MTQNYTQFSNSKIEQLKKKIANLEEKLLLVSGVYRYEALQNYLKQKNWLEADRETVRLILSIAGKEKLEDMRPEDIKHLDCSELQIIDRLWLTYSNNHFGFSIQAQIYRDLGGSEQTTIEQNSKLIEQWGDLLGWRKDGSWIECSNLEYSKNAAKGSLPGLWWNSPYGSKMTNYFLARLINCEI
ncbi:GUN4 domain-containing protein [Myxosarcina sp. GI1]|uniref:GUN4 domain-containing protein n=1 Tax=Myxosarcina sp. GI1 TaxID=1541065 RepID=UPI0005639BC0|nr:GUN4 domain-containing protein [Myxosarcina sp. GI1]